MPYLPPLCSARKGTVADMDVLDIWLAVGLGTIGLELKDVIFGCGYGLWEHAVVKKSMHDMVRKVPVGRKMLRFRSGGRNRVPDAVKQKLVGGL